MEFVADAVTADPEALPVTLADPEREAELGEIKPKVKVSLIRTTIRTKKAYAELPVAVP